MFIKRLHFGNFPISRHGRTYPDPSRWCDAVVEHLRLRRVSRDSRPPRRAYSDAAIAAMFRCPATDQRASADMSKGTNEANGTQPNDETVRSWVSDYAMNPDCEPNSPPDTVLLLEAEPSWNRHGGPALFTFDNHDPKGGLVLLNDGTVKFIRTEEELTQLRWK